MNTSASVLLLTALFFVATAAPRNINTLKRMSSSRRSELQERVVRMGCNANICFAIDGSGSISPADFSNALNFVLDVVAIVTSSLDVGLAATQFGTGNSVISRLTFSAPDFRKAVSDASQLGGNSNISGGLTFCVNELRKSPEDANKIVLISDGRGGVDDDPASVADLFRLTGGEVCVASVGFAGETELLRIAGGDQNKVFRAGSFIDVLNLGAAVESLVTQVCGT